MTRLQLLILFLVSFSVACEQARNQHATVSSPDGMVEVEFVVKSDGTPAYLVKYRDTILIDTSTLGFTFRDQPTLKHGLKITSTNERTVQETWPMPWGEQLEVENHFNELIVHLEEQADPKRKLDITFRAYDDGIGFRYTFPHIGSSDTTIILDEHTRFNLTGNHTVWWQPGDWDIYEHLYHETSFSEINAIQYRDHPNLMQTYIPENAVNTPVTMKTTEGVYLSFHEANLTDYAGMTLKVDAENLLMESELVGSDRLGWKVLRTGPFHTPWRSIQIAERAGDLIESKLIVNLNEPNKLGDVSWFTPMKYAGIWWDMHLGIKSFGISGGNHGATTKYAKEMVDFAAANGIQGLLVEGWYTGWDGYQSGLESREGSFDFVTPYPDYDLEEVVRYSKARGIQLIMHHETSAAPRAYEQQLDTAYSLMKRLGIHAAKTGYVGTIIPEGEYHHGQWMVNHYRKVLETAAQYQIAINAHEPIKATGIRRTYPNAISREGLRGQEFNAWAIDGGNPPDHLPTVAFTRMLAGPIDYTPGIFNIKLDPYKPDNQVNTTLAHQLALYVVIYSPVQMVPDLMEYYEGHPAFQFIRDVGVDWAQTKVLDGEVGDFVVIAREERETGNWFLGAITNEEGRTMNFNLDFLPPGKTFQATLYLDGEDAHWDKNPTAYRIENRTVTSGDALELRLAPGGGSAISFKAQ